MPRFLNVFILALTVSACTVQPLTPTPVEVTVLPVLVAVATFTPIPEQMFSPTEAPTEAASATPEALPSPTELPFAALVANSTSAPTDILVIAAPPPTAIQLPTDIAQNSVATAVPPVWVAPPPSDDVAAAEQYCIDLINVQRIAAGVAPLQRDETLMSIARARVADMVARGYTGHNDPVTGEGLARSMMRAAGYMSSYVGENWYGSIQPPPGIVDTAMTWFMTDPPHARNILNPNYVGVGVGIAFNGRQWLLVQNFAGPNE